MNLIPLIIAFASMAAWLAVARGRMGRMKDTGGWVQFLPAAISLVSGLLNKKKAPAPVPVEPVDLGAEQEKVIDSNLEQEGDIEKLLQRANSFTQGQANDLMEKAVPGYSSFAKRLLGSGTEALENQYDLPPEVEENLARISAEQGLQRGTRGQFNKFSATRDLGVNMLQYGQQRFQQALQALTAVTGTAPRVSPMSPLSFYVTPGMAVQNQQLTNSQNQQTQQGGENARTAADNWNSQNLWDSLAQSAGMVDWDNVFAPKSGAATAGDGGGS